MFGGRELSPLPHNRVAAGDSELQSDALEAGTGENTAFRLPYPREETRSLEQDTFGSFSPTGPSTMESGGKRPSSVASNGSPRRRSNVPPVRATGPRPPFGGLGFRFEQSSDEDKGNSREVETLLTEIEEWKSKYFTLKDEYESLSHDYDLLLAKGEKGGDSEAIKQKDETIRHMQQEMNTLQNKLQQQRAVVAPSGAESEKKIMQQNEEIQKLLEQRIELETELSQLRYKGVAETTPGEVVISASPFEQDRAINNLRATIKQKDQMIEELSSDLQLAKSELTRLGGVMGLVADQVEKDEKKKKKTWWGGSKKAKHDPSKLTAAELDALARDASIVGGGGPDSPRSVVSAQPEGSPVVSASKPRVTTLSPDTRAPARPPGDMAGVFINKRMLELERENARLEGEISILEKEKQAVGEKLKRTEAQVEVLQKARRIEEGNLQAIAVAKSLSVPLPQDGGSESDRLKAVIQLQESALQRLSLTNQQLEDTVYTYASKHGDVEEQLALREGHMRNELSETSQEMSTLRQTKHRLEEEVQLQRVKLDAYEAEVNRLKDTVAYTQEATQAGAAKLKKQSDTYALMLGNLLKDGGMLQKELSGAKAKHSMDAKVYQGEVRLLREGRVQRLDGDRADRRLFPTTVPDTILPLRLPELQEIEPSQPDLPSLSEEMWEERFLESLEHPPPPSPPPPSPPSSPPLPLPPSPSIAPSSPPSLPAEPLGSPTDAYHYEWTPAGYHLHPELPSPIQRGVSPSIRPVVTVELKRGPGPFPAEQVDLPSTGLATYPEIDSRDQALAQSALKEWFKNPPVPRSPSPGPTPAPAPPKSPAPRRPPIRTAADAVPHHPLFFDPLASRSESKTSEAEVWSTHPPTHPDVPVSDWGAYIPAALLSFGRPSAEPASFGERIQTPVRPKPEFETRVLPEPFELKEFPMTSIEPKKSAARSLIDDISPPSTSHPLLGHQVPAELDQTEPKGLEKAPGISAFPRPEAKSVSLEPLSARLPRADPKPAREAMIGRETKPEPKPILSARRDIPAPEPNLPLPEPKPVVQVPENRILGTEEDIRKRRLYSMGSEDIARRRRLDSGREMKHVLLDDQESREYTRRVPQYSSGSLIDDLSKVSMKVDMRNNANQRGRPEIKKPPELPKSEPAASVRQASLVASFSEEATPISGRKAATVTGLSQQRSSSIEKRGSAKLHPKDAEELKQDGELFGFKGDIEELDRLYDEEQQTPARDFSEISESYDLRRPFSAESKEGQRALSRSGSFLTSSFGSQFSDLKHTPSFDARVRTRARLPSKLSDETSFPDLNQLDSNDKLFPDRKSAKLKA